MGGRGVQSGHRETSEKATASNSNKSFWGHGWQGQWWPEVEGPASAHLCFHQGPNTLTELKLLPVILQVHWALSQSQASTQAARCQECPFQLWLLGELPTLPQRLSSSVTSPACFSYCPLLPWYDWTASPLPEHPQMASFCSLQQKRGKLTVQIGPPDSKDLCIFS